MKPVTQTEFGEEKGNCFQACLASVLEIDIQDVPWFDARSDWMYRVNDFLVPFDLFVLDVDIDSFRKGAQDPSGLGYHLISGPSPRGKFWHSVVGRQGKMVHDPHPSRDGLEKEMVFTLFVKRFETVPRRSRVRPVFSRRRRRETLDDILRGLK